jgi:predicted RNA polymerase sigma factor
MCCHPALAVEAQVALTLRAAAKAAGHPLTAIPVRTPRRAA